jgi:hypothetical protein
LDTAALFVALGGGWCQDPSGCADTQISSDSQGPTPVAASSTHRDHP